MKHVFTKYALLFFTFFTFSLTASSQSDEVVSKPQVQVLARPLKEKILLRWAPNTPLSWEYANKYGYVVERYTLLRDSVLVTKPKKVILRSCLKIGKRKKKAPEKDQLCIAKQKRSLTDASSQK